MSEATFAIVHELSDQSQPDDGVNRMWWWVVINGARITGCYSEHEAREHLDTAEQAYEAGRASALGEGTEVWVVWFRGDDAEESGLCKTGENGTHALAFTDPQAAYDLVEDYQRPEEFEVRAARLVVKGDEK